MFRARATALFSYKAEADDELSFEKGESINIKSTKGGHWWYGEHKGCAGCVPKKYLKLEVLGNFKVTISYTPRESDDLNLLQGNIVEVLIKEKDKWFGRIGKLEGWFPPNYVVEVTQSTQGTQENPKPTSRPSSISGFDEITNNAVVLEDVRKQRPKKPSTSRMQRNFSIEEEVEDEVDAQQTIYDTPAKPQTEEIQPKKIEHQTPAWLIELKRAKFTKSKSLHDIDKQMENKRLSVIQPKPVVVNEPKSNTQQEHAVDLSKMGQMRKDIEALTESPKRDLEQRVELLEKLTIAMMEQLTDMRKDLMKLKSMELQKIVPF